jgi:hypothetical protein
MNRLIRTEADLLEAVRARIRELDVTHATVDSISGMADGYTSKLMAGMKGIGPKSWPLLAGALGLALRLDVDPEWVSPAAAAAVAAKPPAWASARHSICRVRWG